MRALATPSPRHPDPPRSDRLERADPRASSRPRAIRESRGPRARHLLQSSSNVLSLQASANSSIESHVVQLRSTEANDAKTLSPLPDLACLDRSTARLAALQSPFVIRTHGLTHISLVV